MIRNGYNFSMKNKSPHRSSLRLPEYDYSQEGAYFVTIVTQGRQCLFGEVVNGEMRLNPAGLMVEQVWKEIPAHFPHVELGEFVLMPNHIHGIIMITRCVGATHASPLRNRHNGPLPGSLGAIIGSFKSAASKIINMDLDKYFGQLWQRNYYEHIIRDENDLQIITDYILTNPQNWVKDEEYLL